MPVRSSIKLPSRLQESPTPICPKCDRSQRKSGDKTRQLRHRALLHQRNSFLYNILRGPIVTVRMIAYRWLDAREVRPVGHNVVSCDAPSL